LIEPLCDRFDPALCDVYAALFTSVIEQLNPGLPKHLLLDRYQRVRRPQPFRGEPAAVFILSRVTLGADVAVTSVMLDAAAKRFPKARIVFVGSQKAYQLFDADDRIEFLAAPYSRAGALRDRINAGLALQPLLHNGLVIDPDSRLTQLGLLPVCDESRYLFFESRAYGGDSDQPLGALAAGWAREVLEVDAHAYIKPRAAPVDDRDDLITISLGVGENPSKRLDGIFEADLFRKLASTGAPILADLGMGGDEAARVNSAIEASQARPGQVRSFLGPFAPFAATIARSARYVGYDSSGQHVAATCGVPLLTVFVGYVSERFRQRWTPYGPGPKKLFTGSGFLLEDAL
jgi:ADP-heptose:LPS heptosyltransferase